MEREHERSEFKAEVRFGGLAEAYSQPNWVNFFSSCDLFRLLVTLNFDLLPSKLIASCPCRELLMPIGIKIGSL